MADSQQSSEKEKENLNERERTNVLVIRSVKIQRSVN